MQSGPVPPQSNSTHRAWCVAGCPARLPSRMPQRGNGTKPRVAAFAPLPWVGRPTHRPNPNGVVALRRGACPQREHHDGVLDRGAPVLPGRCPGLAYNALSGLRTAGPARPAGHTSRTPSPIASTSQGPTAGQPRPRMNGHARNQPTPQPTAHSLDRSRASRAQRWLSPTRVAAGQPFASIRDLFGGGPDPYVPAMRTSPAGPGRPCHLKTTREPGTCYAGCAGPPATACRHG
jgi:hypothetical protein